jgi:hypothetical protein
MGFFQDISGYFQQEYSGRYLAVLLCELARNEPDSFAKVIEHAANTSDIKSDVQGWKKLSKDIRRAGPNGISFKHNHYPFARGKRKADVALLRDKQPLALAEIKEDDFKSPGNVDQLADYLKEARDRHVRFIHISRYAPRQDYQNKIRNTKRDCAVLLIRYRQLYDALKNRAHKGPIADMLSEYMEDIGVSTFQTIERRESNFLIFLLTRILNFPHATQLGKVNSIAAVAAFPVLVKRLFDNLEFVSEWIQQKNADIIKNRFTRNMSVWPTYDLKSVETRLLALSKIDKKNPDVLPDSQKDVRVVHISISVQLDQFEIRKLKAHRACRSKSDFTLVLKKERSRSLGLLFILHFMVAI